MRILILIISLVFVYHSVAESDQDSEIKIEQTNSENQPNQTEPQAKKQSSTPDTFNPSEKLSQDVPTAFPVDI